jgi:hypothetical protein
MDQVKREVLVIVPAAPSYEALCRVVAGVEFVSLTGFYGRPRAPLRVSWRSPLDLGGNP